MVGNVGERGNGTSAGASAGERGNGTLAVASG
jgi:hypothetical protein